VIVKRIFNISVALLLVVLFGCHTKSSQNPKDYSDSLLVLSGASDISYAKVGNTDQVMYTVKVEYPALNIINELQSKTDGKGWSPLKEDFMNPGIPTSIVRGWTKFEDASKQPITEVHAWVTDWQNKKGDILQYHLTYRYPIKSQPDMSSLKVVAIYFPADTAAALKKASFEMLQQYNKKDIK
jgi:hypothetical protein